ncbi:MAG: hypothetical protein AAF629_21495 [Chloroflexota bacterium]
MTPNPPSLSLSRIFQTFWPLAVGWLLMTVEIPILTAIIARFPEPEINLAAWGIAFSVTLIIGSPSIMFLPTSTTFSKDWASYQSLRSYMVTVLGLLTLLHVLVAFTPLYDWLVVGLIGVPAEIVEPARWGVQIMTPWAIGVGYRRFNYGVLIRFGQTKALTVGVVFRLISDVIVFSLFYAFGGAAGVTIATAMFTLGILAEAVYSRVRVHAILSHDLKLAPAVAQVFTIRDFMSFFIPLALTGFLQMVMQPVISAGLSRMPNALESLAVWHVVYGLLIIFTSAGMSYTEVVVVLLDESQSVVKLRRFTALLGSISATLLLVMCITPLSRLWFQYVSGLPVDLISLATWCVLITLPLPILRVLESWYQGILMNTKQTRSITESVVVFLVANGLFLAAGVSWGTITGLYIGLWAMVFGDAMRTIWLWYRTRPNLQAIQHKEATIPTSV